MFFIMLALGESVSAPSDLEQNPNRSNAIFNSVFPNEDPNANRFQGACGLFWVVEQSGQRYEPNITLPRLSKRSTQKLEPAAQPEPLKSVGFTPRNRPDIATDDPRTPHSPNHRTA